MIVLIDSGNTRLKVALLGAAPLVDPVSLTALRVFENHDEPALLAWLASLPTPPRAALGTNVAGAARARAIEAALAQHRCPVRWVTPQAQAYGLTSRYCQPAQLGADRWVAMIGVRACIAAPASHFLLANFGTATTLDTVNAQGVFEGGLILPGPGLMRHTLAANTAALPLAQAAVQDFPTDTHAGIASGVAAAQAGALVRQWLMTERRYSTAPAIYISGGGWAEIAGETQRLLAETAALIGRVPPSLTVIENPVLSGLAYLATHRSFPLP